METVHSLTTGLSDYLKHRGNQIRCGQSFIVFSYREVAVLGKHFKKLFGTRRDQEMNDVTAGIQTLHIVLSMTERRGKVKLSVKIPDLPNTSDLDLGEQFSVLPTDELVPQIAIEISRRK